MTDLEKTRNEQLSEKRKPSSKKHFKEYTIPEDNVTLLVWWNGSDDKQSNGFFMDVFDKDGAYINTTWNLGPMEDSSFETAKLEYEELKDDISDVE